VSSRGKKERKKKTNEKQQQIYRKNIILGRKWGKRKKREENVSFSPVCLLFFPLIFWCAGGLFVTLSFSIY
jgi:hypothetical protein